MNARHGKSFIFAMAFATAAMAASLTSCNKQNNAQVQHTGELRFKTTGPFDHDLLTPTGEKVFQESIKWLTDQPNSRARPANCAYNVSDVYENAGLTRYSSPLVPDMINAVEDRGGKVIRFATRSKSDFIRIVNAELGGRIPTGALVAGCANRSCSGEAGSGHIAIMGDNDANGYAQLYHNNWYRPDNEGGQWRSNMISRQHYNSGNPRQWMPTPWLKFVRDDSGKIADVVSAYPNLHGVDDLDPFTYYGFIAIPKEIWREVGSSSAELCTSKEHTVTPFRYVLTGGMRMQVVGNQNRVVADLAATSKNNAGATLAGERVELMFDARSGNGNGLFIYKLLRDNQIYLKHDGQGDRVPMSCRAR